MTKIRFSHNRQHRYTLRHHRRSLFYALVLTLLTGGCIRMEPTPVPTWSPPEEYITAKEAYARALPTIRQWEQEFVVGGITAPSFDVPAWCPRQDGTAAAWYFRVFSPTRWTIFSYLDGAVHDRGCSDKPDKHQCPDLQLANPIPMEQIIDSDQAIFIARQNGISATLRMTEITEAVFTSTRHPEGRLTWLLMFDASEGADNRVYVDMLTGEVLDNDFLDITSPNMTETEP